MKSSQIMVLILVLAGVQQAFACGYEMGAVKPGEKNVAIELNQDGKKSYAFDDDGILVLSIVMAHCNKSIPEKNGDNRPLACQKEVSSIVKKVAIRSKEYFKEQTSPENLEELNLSGKQKRDFLISLKQDRNNVELMNTLFSKPSLTNIEFKNAMASFEYNLKYHGYIVTTDPDGSTNPDNYQGLESIMMSMGADLPYIPRTRCGMAMPDSVIAKLKDAEWKNRAASGSSEGANQGVAR
jgi:hypothetical protein